MEWLLTTRYGLLATGRERGEDLVEAGAGLAGLEFGWGFVDHDAALGDEDEARADSLDLLPDVGGGHDGPVLGGLLGEGADLGFLIGGEAGARSSAPGQLRSGRGGAEPRTRGAGGAGSLH